MIYELKDLKLYYMIEGEGVPILMLHGRPTDHHAMVGAFEPIFSDRNDWQRIYIDLPGMGATQGGSWINGNKDIVEVLLSFIDEVLGKQPFAIAGFSYGGYLTRGLLHLRASQTVGALLLVPAMEAGEERNAPENAAYFGDETALFDRYPQPFADQFKQITMVHEAAVIDRMGEILQGLQAADHEFNRRIEENYTLPYPLEHSPANYDRPMLILTGKQDIVTGFETANEWHKQFPHATFVCLDRAGHGLHMEQPTLFNALVNDWLNRMEESMQQIGRNKR